VRTPLIAGNWKMNLTIREAESLAQAVGDNANAYNDRKVLVFPTFLQIKTVHEILAKTNVMLGAQNCSGEKEGAFTGEISAAQLKDAGVQYVLIGHSERRHVLKESEEFLKSKLDRVLEQGLAAMLCVGETLAEREAGKAEEIVIGQINSVLASISANEWQQISIAYEPVWAIGTGKNATPEDAQSMHATIRKRVAELNKDIAPKIRILYGGSVKPDNIAALMAKEDIDGALVGGASLKASSFGDLIKNAI
jgi:triosephosphate isomerase